MTALSSSGDLTPHCLRSLGSASLSAFSSSVWMVYRVHRSTTDSRTNSLPATASSFTIIFQMMFFVGNGADRCPATLINFPDFRGRHFQICISVGIGDYLSEDTSRTADFRATHRFDFNIVNKSSNWNIFKWKSVAWLQWSFLGDDEGASRFHGLR